MDEQKVPPRWDFEVRVMTPDHQVIYQRVTASPDYMDLTFAEFHLDSLKRNMVQFLKDKGYFD